MSLIQTLIDFILHLDHHLAEIVSNYGTFTYLILFLIIFAETGLVVTPFLPGDSLLFATGAITALPDSGLNLALMGGLLFLAAVLGDTVNYMAGKYFGKRVYNLNSRFIKREYLDQTHAFYDKYGGRTIIYARFIPIIRTFAPFVAGIGAMNYRSFIVYNIVGGFIWVGLFLMAGYFFGNVEFVRNNFSLVILGIILVSLLPPIIQVLISRMNKNKNLATENKTR